MAADSHCCTDACADRECGERHLCAILELAAWSASRTPLLEGYRRALIRARVRHRPNTARVCKSSPRLLRSSLTARTSKVPGRGPSLRRRARGRCHAARFARRIADSAVRLCAAVVQAISSEEACASASAREPIQAARSAMSGRVRRRREWARVRTSGEESDESAESVVD